MSDVPLPPHSISIAVCTYNGERFLQAQLDSLLAQTRLPDEIILRDDASSDATMDIVAAFIPRATAAGIRVDAGSQPHNVGYRRNFDAAISACSGELIFLCDQDDAWHADKLARFSAAFAARPALLALHSNARLIDADGAALPGSLFSSLKIRRGELDAMHRGQALTTLLRRNIATGAAMAFRRTLLASVLPLPAEGWVHDAWIITIAAMLGEVDTLESPSIDYRLHGNNQLGVGPAKRPPLLEQRRRMKQQLAQHLLALQLHARALPVDEDVRRFLATWVDYAQMRATLPAGVLGRIAPVFRHLCAGHYQRFSRGGPITAALDLAGL